MRIALWLCLLAIVPVRADDLLVRLRTAPAGEAGEAVQAVLDAGREPSEIVAALAKPVEVPAAEPGWHEAEAKDENGVARPFEFYVPKSIGAKPAPLLVHLHGGVSRPEWFPNPGRRSTGRMWVESAEEHGFILAFPYGRRDCTWWSAAGAANVRAVIREMKRRAPVDDDAILGTGFSDGASGCYYLALAEPDPFAAFLPLNGHFAVAARASDENLYLQNLQTPLFIAQTQDDPLYPAASLLPHVAAAMNAGAPVHLVSYPAGGHRPAYFEEQAAAMARFVAGQKRIALPRSIRWRCATPRLGRVAWLEITRIGESDSDPEPAGDVNVMSTPGRVRVGISLDMEHEGEGVRIDRVTENSLAAKCGMKPGDVLVALDGEPVRGFAGLRALLGKKSHGDAVSFALRRADGDVAVEGRFPPFEPSPVYRREGATAEIDLQSEGNRVVVRCRNVRSFRLWLSPRLFRGDLALAVNGRRVTPDVKEIPLDAVLRRYAREADRGRVFTRVATVAVD